MSRQKALKLFKAQEETIKLNDVEKASGWCCPGCSKKKWFYYVDILGELEFNYCCTRCNVCYIIVDG